MKLLEEYQRISRDHSKALKVTSARVVLGSSVMRVFEPGTKEDLSPCLVAVDVEKMPKLGGQEQFRSWFERNLDRVANAINRRNARNRRIYPGYKWGHATKVLTLYLREIVHNRRYFSDADVERISPWLYTPIDSIAIKRLRHLGCPLPFKAIKEIDTTEKFYDVQELLGEAAAKVGVPRVWFDDNWGDRQ